jgi:hypothetical protein
MRPSRPIVAIRRSWEKTMESCDSISVTLPTSTLPRSSAGVTRSRARSEPTSDHARFVGTTATARETSSAALSNGTRGSVPNNARAASVVQAAGPIAATARAASAISAAGALSGVSRRSPARSSSASTVAALATSMPEFQK